MSPSVRRYINAIWLVLACAFADAGAAQQAATTQPAASAASKEKAAPPKSDAAKRKAAAKADAAPKLDPAAAQGEVENGVNSLAQGRVDAAVTSLSNALSAGSLPSAQTARALYYRGVAYRRQSKPAQAISDLTNALWIKSGLTEEQRADAMQQRSAAFREAGLPDQSDPAAMKQVAAAKPGSAAAPFGAVAPAPPSSSTSLSGSGGGFFSSLFGGGASAASDAKPAAASPPAPPATTASVAPRPAAPAVVGAAPAAAALSSPAAQVPVNPNKPATRLVPVTSSGSSLPLGFQDMSEAVRHVEVSTTARAQQPPAGAAGVGGAMARASEEPKAKQVAVPAAKATPAAAPARASAKEAAPPTKSPPVAVAAAPVPAPQSQPTSTATGRAGGGPAAAIPGGQVRIQVAAVRSAEEAKGVSAKLQSQFATDLGGRAPVVDQVSAGNFGVFYRVQVGPFASVRETEGLCAKLKSNGLDCRVVTQ